MLFLAADDPTLHVRDLVLLKTSGGTPILTMHMVTFVAVAFIFVIAMMAAAKAIATGPEAEGNERYLTKRRFGQLIETLIIALRDEMLMPVLGEKHTRRYLPYLMTVFFFILFQNFFGLIPVVDVLHVFGVHKTPIGGTATANLMVTGALALISFFAIELHGLREQGVKGWLLHNFGGLVPGPIYLLPVALIVFVVELAGHFVKPTALAIRLFANMFAGHTLMAVLVSFGAGAAAGGMGYFGIGAISAASALAAVLITFLELFVAFLHAFIFMFLTAVFISLMSHHDEEHEHEETPATGEPAVQAA
ncbi:MAG: F0F1 ATP synthase subunit A [Planctomycetota bacterium]|jgi:F-type H+-transporting ATPase subunit a